MFTDIQNISSIITIIANIVIIISVVEIRLASKSLKFQGILHATEIMKDISSKSSKFYNSENLRICRPNEFSNNPPKKRKKYRYPEEYFRKSSQNNYDGYLDEECYKSAKECINLLNDIGSLIDNHIIGYEDVLCTYHTSIIRLVSIIEPIRRDIEYNNTKSIGGNYGHRVLRLYHQALNYNKMYSKHRDVDINLSYSGGRVCLVQAENGPILRKFFVSLKYRIKFYKIKYFY